MFDMKSDFFYFLLENFTGALKNRRIINTGSTNPAGHSVC